jgi:hypothetical protein
MARPRRLNFKKCPLYISGLHSQPQKEPVTAPTRLGANHTFRLKRYLQKGKFIKMPLKKLGYESMVRTNTSYFSHLGLVPVAKKALFLFILPYDNSEASSLG